MIKVHVLLAVYLRLSQLRIHLVTLLSMSSCITMVQTLAPAVRMQEATVLRAQDTS